MQFLQYSLNYLSPILVLINEIFRFQAGVFYNNNQNVRANNCLTIFGNYNLYSGNFKLS